MKTHRLLIPLMLLVLAIAVQAQDDYKYSKAKYPVLYLLDGETHFQHASSAADNLVVNKSSEKLKPFKDTKYFYMTVGDEDRYFETLEEYASIMKEKAGESSQAGSEKQ